MFQISLLELNQLFCLMVKVEYGLVISVRGMLLQDKKGPTQRVHLIPFKSQKSDVPSSIIQHVFPFACSIGAQNKAILQYIEIIVILL